MNLYCAAMKIMRRHLCLSVTKELRGSDVVAIKDFTVKPTLRDHPKSAESPYINCWFVC